MAKGPLSAADRARVFKALADPRRVDIVDALAAHGSMCGTELAERLDVSLALLCHHWDVLVDAGLVKKSRVGQLRMCTLDPTRLYEATRPFHAESAVEVPSSNTLPRKKKRPAATKRPAAKTRASTAKKTPSTNRARVKR